MLLYWKLHKANDTSQPEKNDLVLIQQLSHDTSDSSHIAFLIISSLSRLPAKNEDMQVH